MDLEVLHDCSAHAALATQTACTQPAGSLTTTILILVGVLGVVALVAWLPWRRMRKGGP